MVDKIGIYRAEEFHTRDSKGVPAQCGQIVPLFFAHPQENKGNAHLFSLR